MRWAKDERNLLLRAGCGLWGGKTNNLTTLVDIGTPPGVPVVVLIPGRVKSPLQS